MSNIFDYLIWRADIPFSTDNFGEVDALVLAELSYTKFEGIVSNGSIGLPVAREYFFNKHNREDLLKLTSFTATAPLLMDYMYDGARFGNMQICNYVNTIDLEKNTQFSAVTYLCDNDVIFVAFRGTDGTVVGWKEDFNLSYLPETEGQRLAVEYLNKVGRDFKKPIIVGGHSKGGNFASYAASFCDGNIQKRIKKVYSFDAPGFKPDKTELPGYKRILPRIIRIIPDTSIIGRLLAHGSEEIIIKSNASGIFQHDAFSWEISRNRFVRAQISDIGKAISDTMAGWLKEMTDDERQKFTDTIFSVIESTGNDTFHKMSEQKWKTTEAIITSMKDISKDNRKEMAHMLGKLLQTGGHTAVSYLPKFNNDDKTT